MYGEQRRAQHLFGVDEVPDIGAREARARPTGARLVERAEVAREAGVSHVQAPLTREGRPQTRGSGGKHAVEHVDAQPDRFEHGGRAAYPHQVAGPVGRQRSTHRRERFEHQLVRLAYRVASDAVSEKADRSQPLDALGTQVGVHPTLDDTEQRLVFSAMRLLASFRPLGASTHRGRHVLPVGRVGRALIELHDDIGAQLLLDAHVVLGRPEVPRAVDYRAKANPLIRKLQRVGETEDLEPARIGEDASVPVHEAVQAAGLLDDVRAGAQEQMVRVGQHHLR